MAASAGGRHVLLETAHKGQEVISHRVVRPSHRKRGPGHPRVVSSRCGVPFDCFADRVAWRTAVAGARADEPPRSSRGGVAWLDAARGSSADRALANARRAVAPMRGHRAATVPAGDDGGKPHPRAPVKSSCKNTRRSSRGGASRTSARGRATSAGGASHRSRRPRAPCPRYSTAAACASAPRTPSRRAAASAAAGAAPTGSSRARARPPQTTRCPSSLDAVPVSPRIRSCSRTCANPAR